MAIMVTTKCLSLVEQKRIQWAKEKEELAGLCAPWGPPSIQRDNYRTCIRTRFVASTTDLTQQEEQHQQDEVSRSYNYSELTTELKAAADRMRRKRSPSLPPIYSRTAPTCQDEELIRINRYENNPEPEDEHEGETSGYASDSGGTSNERSIDYWNQQRQGRSHHQHHDNWMSDNQRYEKLPRRYSKHSPWLPTSRRYGTPDSVVSTPPCRLWSCGGSDEVNRLRWGDRGVGVGHLWEPTLHEPDARLPQVQGSERGTPNWLERGLSKLNNCDSSVTSSTQVLVINHGSPEQSSPLNRDFAGSCDTISTQSDCNRTFIRGQNAPLEPEVLLERERKRQKAMEHQNAIRLQLEERERKRKEERERRIREEREEEERIKREQEVERKRIEEEQRRVKEREDKEVRKAAAMREALENAEKKAREEKSRASRKHILESLISNCSTCVTNDVNENKCWFDAKATTIDSVISNGTTAIQTAPQIKDAVTDKCNDIISSNVVSNNASMLHEDIRKTHDGTQTGSEGHNEAVLIAAETVAMPADGLAVVLGNTAEGSSHDMIPTPGGSVQLALLMSPSLQQPLMLENRLLTPSKYRTMGRERGTQTDSELVIGSRGRRKEAGNTRIARKERKKSASLERPHQGCKLPLRCRSQSQPTQPRIKLEDRPKWGVNRPGTQYIKQSEKDPYYQRRLRQRLLRAAMLGGGDTGTESDTGSHRRSLQNRASSDENSRSPSPHQRPYTSSSKISHIKNVYYYHRTKTLDRNANNIEELGKKFLRSIENEQLDNKSLLLRERNYTVSTPNKRVQVVVPSPNINEQLLENTIDNRKSTKQQTSSHKISSTGSQYYTTKGSRRLLNRQSEMPIVIDSSIEDQWSSAHDILSQLSTLRQGLLMKQQEWDSTRSQTPYSESSWNS